MKYKKMVSLVLIALMMVVLLSGCSTTEEPSSQPTEEPTEEISENAEEEIDYPNKTINGSIVWAAGGGCDIASRGFNPYAEEALGQSIVLTNRPGASNAIAVNYVYRQPADGYNLLYGAESIQSGKVMGVTDLDLDDFEAINIYTQAVTCVLVNVNSPYETLEDLVEDMLARPGEVTMATSGPSGSPGLVNALMSDILGTEAKLIAYEGDGPAATALMGEQVDFTAITLNTASEAVKAGKLRALASIHNSEIPGFDIQPITDSYPEFDKYLPWGPFFGVFVKKGTPDEIVEILQEAYMEAFNNQEFQKFLISTGNIPLGLVGEEGNEYASKFKSITSWLLYDTGAALHSPEDFGIEKVE